MNASSYLKIVEISSNLPNFSQDESSTQLQEFKELDSLIKKMLDSCNYKMSVLTTLIPEWKKLEISIKEEKSWLQSAVCSLHDLNKLVSFQIMLPQVQVYKKNFLELPFHKKELDQFHKEFMQLEKTHNIEMKGFRVDFEECNIFIKTLENEIMDVDFIDFSFSEEYTRSIVTIKDICTKPLFLVCVVLYIILLIDCACEKYTSFF